MLDVLPKRAPSAHRLATTTRPLRIVSVLWMSPVPFIRKPAATAPTLPPAPTMPATPPSALGATNGTSA